MWAPTYNDSRIRGPKSNRDRVWTVSRGQFLEEFKAFIGKELTKYARIVKESGAKVD